MTTDDTHTLEARRLALANVAAACNAALDAIAQVEKDLAALTPEDHAAIGSLYVAHDLRRVSRRAEEQRARLVEYERTAAAEAAAKSEVPHA